MSAGESCSAIRRRAAAGPRTERWLAGRPARSGGSAHQPSALAVSAWDVPRVGVQRAERPVEQIDRDRAHGGDQAVQSRPGAFCRLGSVRWRAWRRRPGNRLSSIAVLRHLVAVAQQRAFGTVQREAGLPGHEMRCASAGAAPARSRISSPGRPPSRSTAPNARCSATATRCRRTSPRRSRTARSTAPRSPRSPPGSA